MSSSTLPPLSFEPLLKEKIWGGDALGARFNKAISPGARIGESWEISGYGDDQSIARETPVAGTPLGTIAHTSGETLLGAGIDPSLFPLLYKFIDANDKLSVQVHPDDEQARKNNWGAVGKTECWYIAHARPGARIICGVREGVSREDVRAGIEDNTLGELLNFLDIHEGDMLFVPAGTVHAIMDGTILYETQETSDTTFRLYDWGRVDSEGKSRPLHIEQSLQVLDTTFHRRHIIPPIDCECDNGITRRFRVACRYFAVEEYLFSAAARYHLPRKRSFQTIAVLDGTCEIHTRQGRHHATTGDSILLPACLQDIELRTDKVARLLLTSVPELEREIVEEIRHHNVPNDDIELLGGHPSRNDLLQFL